jgi:hypothetical protein
MSDASFSTAPALAASPTPVAQPAQQPCEECVGSGGWYRYEPALDPAPGLLYLSCVQCRGSGRTALARA